MKKPLLFIMIGLLAAGPASGQHIEVETLELENGMTFLLLPRDEQPNAIAAGWVAKVGSVNERPGITGMSHFFEHMMFKGTQTIGTSDAPRDAEYRRRLDEIKSRINDRVWTGQYDRHRRGEIADPWDQAADTDELRALRGELRTLTEEHTSVIVENEFDMIYTNAGGSGLNAFTTHDLTYYFITIPSNKFELWAWMESDRLTDSVFREFYAERDVVHEERRQRTESTPTGIFQEQFDAMFWQSSPYAWPVIGWTSDLNSYTLDEARRFFDVYYQPSNLVGVVVGDFDLDDVRARIRQYFDRLPPGPAPAPPVVTLEMPQRAAQLMRAECECQPQVEVRYHTVPFGHADNHALEVMAQLLNGRTGRLYKSLVEQQGLAAGAAASAGGFGQPARYGGFFSFTAQVKADARPEDLEQAWYAELRRLQEEPVPVRELQKVKNRAAADAFRALQDNFILMLQLGYYEALGGWQAINTRPAALQAVTAENIRRVANSYFAPHQRNIAIYDRVYVPGSVDPDFAALDPVQQQQATMLLAQVASYDLRSLQQARIQLAVMREQVVPAEAAKTVPMINYLLRKMDERIVMLQQQGVRQQEENTP